LNQLSLAGPYTHDNLSLYLLLGRDTFDGQRFIPLDDALEQKCVVVHETGDVGELEVENLSDVFDLYIQAGDVVKGGRQDRTLGVDFVLPARSGRVPVPSFCVESGRWRRRAREAVGTFASSKSTLSSKKLRLAAKLSQSQDEVWQKVAETQGDLSASLDKKVCAAASPTSYQLTVEDKEVRRRVKTYRAALAEVLNDQPRALGYAFVINGEINTADAYGSGALFRKLWPKLLSAAILEAIAELRRQPEPARPAVTAETIQQWFTEAEGADYCERREVPPRVRVDTRRSARSIVFDTCDHGLADAVLHRNLVAQ
jgi:hypothetical protein